MAKALGASDITATAITIALNARALAPVIAPNIVMLFFGLSLG